MNCPHCGAWSTVNYTKMPRRRRECANGHKFTTQEVCIDLQLKEAKQKSMQRARLFQKQIGNGKSNDV